MSELLLGNTAKGESARVHFQTKFSERSFCLISQGYLGFHTLTPVHSLLKATLEGCKFLQTCSHILRAVLQLQLPVIRSKESQRPGEESTKNGKKGDVREHRLGLPYSAIPSLRRYSKDVLAKVPSDDCRQLLKQYYLLYQKNGINPDINQWETTWYIHILEIPTIIVNEDAIYPLI